MRSVCARSRSLLKSARRLLEACEHLTNAALSLALAFKGLMEGVETPSDRSEPIEPIDLDLDPDGPED